MKATTFKAKELFSKCEKHTENETPYRWRFKTHKVASEIVVAEIIKELTFVKDGLCNADRIKVISRIEFWNEVNNELHNI